MNIADLGDGATVWSPMPFIDGTKSGMRWFPGISTGRRDYGCMLVIGDVDVGGEPFDELFDPSWLRPRDPAKNRGDKPNDSDAAAVPVCGMPPVVIGRQFAELPAYEG